MKNKPDVLDMYELGEQAAKVVTYDHDTQQGEGSLIDHDINAQAKLSSGFAVPRRKLSEMCKQGVEIGAVTICDTLEIDDEEIRRGIAYQAAQVAAIGKFSVDPARNAIKNPGYHDRDDIKAVLKHPDLIRDFDYRDTRGEVQEANCFIGQDVAKMLRADELAIRVEFLRALRDERLEDHWLELMD